MRVIKSKVQADALQSFDRCSHRRKILLTAADFYSDRSDFTGFVVAALMDSKLIVSQAIISADRNATTKIVQSMVM